MSSDLKTPVQLPIVLNRAGEGPWATVEGAHVPFPPDGCESQQLMDWGSVHAVATSQVSLPMKLRVVQAYADRWGVPVQG